MVYLQRFFLHNYSYSLRLRQQILPAPQDSNCHEARTAGGVWSQHLPQWTVGRRQPGQQGQPFGMFITFMTYQPG